MRDVQKPDDMTPQQQAPEDAQAPSAASLRRYRLWTGLAVLTGALSVPCVVAAVWLLLRGERWAFALGAMVWAFVESLGKARRARAALR